MGTAVKMRSPVLHLATCLSILHFAPSCMAQHAQFPPPAYSIVAKRSGVPVNVLFAVALQESAVTLRGQSIPWPWTLNIAGQARYFTSQAVACHALQIALVEVPDYRIDAGLTQINLRHQRRFYRHPCDLLQPQKNLEIAATILREQYRAGENWLSAAGRYHRPAGGPIAARYRHRIAQRLDQLAVANGSRP